jgi:hypothetical protein
MEAIFDPDPDSKYGSETLRIDAEKERETAAEKVVVDVVYVEGMMRGDCRAGER